MCIHNSISQKNRLERYKQFKENKARILITTKMFGRGVDLERVNLVLNFDMPTNSNEYFHRVGRAGRFGTKGLSITFIDTEDDAKVLEEVQSRFEVKVTPLPDKVDSSTYMAN